MLSEIGLSFQEFPENMLGCNNTLPKQFDCNKFSSSEGCSNRDFGIHFFKENPEVF